MPKKNWSGSFNPWLLPFSHQTSAAALQKATARCQLLLNPWLPWKWSHRNFNKVERDSTKPFKIQ